MAEKISVSFKNTTSEMQLYSGLLGIEDRGNWIKAVLKKELDREKKQSK